MKADASRPAIFYPNAAPPFPAATSGLLSGRFRTGGRANQRHCADGCGASRHSLRPHAGHNVQIMKRATGLQAGWRMPRAPKPSTGNHQMQRRSGWNAPAGDTDVVARAVSQQCDGHRHVPARRDAEMYDKPQYDCIADRQYNRIASKAPKRPGQSVRLALATTASNSTWQPASASPGSMLSASLWDSPSLQGVKIIAVGTWRAT
jgi:hypothetical protein